MVEKHKVNTPIEVWQDNEHPRFLFQVLAHLPSDDLGPRALVASSTPHELDIEGEPMYTDTLRNTCTLVWSESDGTSLPTKYLFEVPEEEEGEEEG